MSAFPIRSLLLPALAASVVMSLGCGGASSETVPKAGGNIDTTGGPRMGRGAPSGGATPPKAAPKPTES